MGAQASKKAPPHTPGLIERVRFYFDWIVKVHKEESEK